MAIPQTDEHHGDFLYHVALVPSIINYY